MSKRKITAGILALLICLTLAGCSSKAVGDAVFEDPQAESNTSVKIPDTVRTQLDAAKAYDFGRVYYLKNDGYELQYPITLGGHNIAKIEVFYISESVDDAKISLDSLDGTLHISTYDDATDEDTLLGIRNSRASIPGDSSVSMTSLYILTNYKAEKAFNLTITVPDDTKAVMVVSANANAWQKDYRTGSDFRTKVQKYLIYGTTEESLYTFDILYDVASTVDDPYSGITPKERVLNPPRSFKGIIILFAMIGFIGATSFLIVRFIKGKKAKELEAELVSSRIEKRTQEAVRIHEEKEINDLETMVSEFDELTESRFFETGESDINEKFVDDTYAQKPATMSHKEESKRPPSWMSEGKTPAWLTESDTDTDVMF